MQQRLRPLAFVTLIVLLLMVVASSPVQAGKPPIHRSDSPYDHAWGSTTCQAGKCESANFLADNTTGRLAVSGSVAGGSEYHWASAHAEISSYGELPEAPTYRIVTTLTVRAETLLENRSESFNVVMLRFEAFNFECWCGPHEQLVVAVNGTNCSDCTTNPAPASQDWTTIVFESVMEAHDRPILGRTGFAVELLGVLSSAPHWEQRIPLPPGLPRELATVGREVSNGPRGSFDAEVELQSIEVFPIDTRARGNPHNQTRVFTAPYTESDVYDICVLGLEGCHTVYDDHTGHTNYDAQTGHMDMEAKHVPGTSAIAPSNGGSVSMRETILLDRPADSIEAVFRINVREAFASADRANADVRVYLALRGPCDECTVEQDIVLVDSWETAYDRPNQIEAEVLEYRLQRSFASGLPIPPGKIEASASFSVYAGSNSVGGVFAPLDQPHARLTATLESMTVTIDPAGRSR